MTNQQEQPSNPSEESPSDVIEEKGKRGIDNQIEVDSGATVGVGWVFGHRYLLEYFAAKCPVEFEE